jgi:hypothetical protein
MCRAQETIYKLTQDNDKLAQDNSKLTQDNGTPTQNNGKFISQMANYCAGHLALKIEIMLYSIRNEQLSVAVASSPSI